MHTFGYFVAFALFGRVIWRLVLKKSAYPEYISASLKRTHALILWFVSINACVSFGELVWLFLHPSQILGCLAGQPNFIGRPAAGVAAIVYSVAGTLLIPVFIRMAKRQGAVLKWFFIFWPLTFIGFVTLVIMRHINATDVLTVTDMVAGIITFLFPTLIFIVTVMFYLRRSSKIIFESPNTSLEPTATALSVSTEK
jgi:hypothetical protein